MNDNSYLYPCPNDGACRQIHLKKTLGIDIEDGTGVIRLEKVSVNNIPSFVDYTSCIMCRLPVGWPEAVKVNRFLGNKLPEEPVDEDFLKVLNEFK